MKMSVRVAAASAISSSLESSWPRRFSYQATRTLVASVASNSARPTSLICTIWPPAISRPMALRTSSKHVTDRKTTIASAPSVSNLPWPYGWSSSGSLAATRTTTRPNMLYVASTEECRASPSTASEPVSAPIVAFVMSTATFATSSPASTRRTARDRSRALSPADMVCKLDGGRFSQRGRSMQRPYLLYLDNCINIYSMNDSLFRALADPTRRKILELLTEKDRTAGEIAEQFPIAFASVSHHLGVLKAADLVATEREGQFIRYRLNTTVFQEVVRDFITRFAEKNNA